MSYCETQHLLYTSNLNKLEKQNLSQAQSFCSPFIQESIFRIIPYSGCREEDMMWSQALNKEVKCIHSISEQKEVWKLSIDLSG